MESQDDVKKLVKEKYGAIASSTSSCGCGPGPSTCCYPDGSISFSDDYTHVKGYAPDADLGLGCGIPTEDANIQAGNTVIDLGSGAGNDAFVASRLVGATGRVIGVDITDEMVSRARANSAKLHVNNVEFRSGDIEHLPVESTIADVVISNCVLNLVPDKSAAFREIYRSLKPGGHFCISDVVSVGTIPAPIRSAAEMYAGCIAGAADREEYLTLIKKTGFTSVTVCKEKQVTVPDDALLRFLSQDELARYRASGAGILSVTVYGVKPE